MDEAAFIALVGHELRGPLAAITAAAHVLQVCDPASADAAQAREVVARQSARLQSTIDELTELSRLRIDRARLHVETVDLAALLREKVPAAEVSVDEAIIDTDRARLEEVVERMRMNTSRWRLEPGRLTVGPLGAGLAAHFMRTLLEAGGARAEIENSAEGRRLVAHLPR
jgi:signal transduction histidine kinase